MTWRASRDDLEVALAFVMRLTATGADEVGAWRAVDVIAERLYLDRITVSWILFELVDAGFVELDDGDDGEILRLADPLCGWPRSSYSEAAASAAQVCESIDTSARVRLTAIVQAATCGLAVAETEIAALSRRRDELVDELAAIDRALDSLRDLSGR